jgi:hypothetical protein
MREGPGDMEDSRRNLFLLLESKIGIRLVPEDEASALCAKKSHLIQASR